MQLCDVLCYLLFTITVTATCARGEQEKRTRGISIDNTVKRLLKRDAAILINNMPIEGNYGQEPRVIYRRVSRQRYGPPKPKYGPPRPKHSPPPKPRKPTKKYRKQINLKYRTPGHSKKRTPKPRYGPPKRLKTNYGPPKKVPPHHYTPEPTGFAEPPADYDSYPNPVNNYAEPPVDSYGAPLKSSVIDNYPTAPISNEQTTQYDNIPYNSYGLEYNSWRNYPGDQAGDNTYAYSKKRPFFVKPDEMGEQSEDEDFNFDSYSNGYNFNHPYKEPPYLSSRRKKPQFFPINNKRVNKHWKSPKFGQENLRPEPEEELLVGGQYAEPPPRYVPKFQPSAPMYTGEDDFAPLERHVDSEVASSATISPYVNYKHSNMAFSPQNLNDAFSIVDK